MNDYEKMTIADLYELKRAYEDATIMAEEHGHTFQATRLSVYVTIISAEINKRKKETEN